MHKQTTGQRSGLCWLWLTAIIFMADRVTKQGILAYFTLGESVELLPFLNITPGFNRGAVFGFLGTASGWQVWLLSGAALAVSTIIVYTLARLAAGRRLLGACLALILGGALGNCLDRFLYGAVIDFIDVHVGQHHWWVFNIADSAICVGAFLLVLAECRRD